ncbi:MAG: PQQ-binding-like beta-propeller repeat protein [Myxococcales bacterium]|nr:PQQ-binding-like beta-propeller repeat protein [Polyangiaceae bacterium]MDW8248008.1 PQQ-binding-like beta-propeller repeat protein [Myxococcales bacterium]
MQRGGLLLLVWVMGIACDRQRGAPRQEEPKKVGLPPVLSLRAPSSTSVPSPKAVCTRDTWPDYGHDGRRTSTSRECIEEPLRLLWKAQATTPVKERPASFDHVVATEEGLYATGLRGKSSMLHGLNLDGTPRWDHDTRTDLHFAFWPLVAHGVVGMNDDGTFFLDPTSGHIKINLGLDSWGQMTADTNQFYWVNTWHVHGPALYVGAFSPSGEALWKQNKYGGAVPMDMMDDLGGVALDGNIVFQAANYKFASFSGVFAFEAATGKLRWSKNGSPVGLPSAADGRVFVVERVQRERRVVARSQHDGELLWSTPLRGAQGAAPALASGLTLVATEQGALVALDASSGQERWRFETGHKQTPVIGHETSIAIAANDRVVFSTGKELILLTLSTGQERWRGEVAGAQVHSPILAGGRVYAVAGGEILAFEGAPLRGEESSRVTP